MDEQTNTQTPGKREITNALDLEFARLHLQSCAIVGSTPEDLLYASPAATKLDSPRSVGESVLRCAAVIEQTFGGITANLWDDPFEWTLPEYLTSPAKVIEHLGEVEETRRRAFSSFADDECLQQQVAMPSGETRPLIDLLRETLNRAMAYQEQSLTALKSLSGNSPPGFII